MLNGDTSLVLQDTHSLIDLGVDPLEIQKQILSSLRSIALTKVGETNILIQSEDLIKKSSDISKKFTLNTIVEITNELSKHEIISGEHPPISLEIALISVIIKNRISVTQKTNLAPTTNLNKNFTKPINNPEKQMNPENEIKEEVLERTE